jgi:hypothetical protein
VAYQTLSGADAILKDLFVGPVIEQLNYKTWMLDRIQRDSASVDFTGRRAIVPVHSRSNRNRASLSDGGTLMTPGTQAWQDAIVTIRYHNIGIALSDQSVKQARGNEGSFVNLLRSEVEGAARDLKKDINRQVYGDGTGILATVTAGGTGATTFTVSSTQYLTVGDPIDVLVRSTGASVTGSTSRTITAINRTTGVVTVDAAIGGTTDNTFGVYLPGSYGLEMDGLRNIISTTGTLHGINRATAGNEFWQSKVVAAGSTVAGESLFGQLLDQIEAGGNGDVDVILTTRGIKRRLAETYQSQKRYNDANAVNIHGGYSSIMVNETPVIADDDVPKGYAFAIDNDAFRWFEVAPPGWLEDPQDGQVFHISNSGSGLSGRRAVWEAWFVWYAALGSLAPNRLGAVTGATDDTA